MGGAGDGWSACSPHGIVFNLIYGSLHQAVSCFPLSGINVQTGQSAVAVAKAKACPEPRHLVPQTISSLASTWKSRLRVPKIPHSQNKQIMDLPLKG